MNKTVTINISGIIFHIEEDAFDSLSRYMQTIKGYFSNTDGGNEIMSDIEARIAELLQQRINNTKQVILMADVNHVMEVMGRPEEFGAENKKDEEQTGDAAQGPAEKIRRKLFRNPDDKMIGGVCSGLAAYFDIEVVWVRLAMFLLLFFGGLSIWAYVILWIIIPQARTTADRFAMRGEAANVNTIYRSFKEEAEDVHNRLSKFGNDWGKSDYGKSVRNNASRAVALIFNILGRLLGLFIFIIGALLLFGYLASLFGISFVDANTDLSQWKRALFDSSSNYVLAVLAYVIVLGIPVLMLIYGGIKLMFRISYSNRWLNLSLGILWLLGLVMGFFVSVSTVKQFSESSRLKETIALRGVGDTLIVKMKSAPLVTKQLNFENQDDLENYFSTSHNWYTFGETGHSSSVIGFAGLDVIETDGDSLDMIITRSSQGGNKRESNENAKAINYNYRLNGNELIFDEVFTTTSGTKFRVQQLDIRLRLPKGKVIYFDKSTRTLLDDVDNTTNTWDEDMISRRWIMTENGLKCIDCQNLEDTSGHFDDWEEDDHHHIHREKVIIDKRGIHVRDKDSEVRIDENGIKIKTPEKNVEVKEEKE